MILSFSVTPPEIASLSTGIAMAGETALMELTNQSLAVIERCELPNRAVIMNLYRLLL